MKCANISSSLKEMLIFLDYNKQSRLCCSLYDCHMLLLKLIYIFFLFLGRLIAVSTASLALYHLYLRGRNLLLKKLSEAVRFYKWEKVQSAILITVKMWYILTLQT